MPYYQRLFSRSPESISWPQLQGCLPDGVTAELDVGTPDNWQAALLRGSRGEEIALVEKADDELLAGEIAEFVEELAEARPITGARWVADYLGEATQLISCQVLDAGFGEIYGGTPGLVLWNIKHALGEGIIQSDGEGFTNLDGYHAVWQFSDDVSGPWAMSVLTAGGQWVAYQMELGDPAQRRAFLEGKVPANVKILDQ